MKTLSELKQFEFEARIFISFSIVIFICIVSFVFFSEYKPLYKIISEEAGFSYYSSLLFLPASILMIMISVLRMWSGSLLSSGTVMSFKVRTESIITSGPYSLVRNPIYFSDWFAMCVFSLFMPFTGLLLPVLFYLHYKQLISYEEKSFIKKAPEGYKEYLKSIPCLIPSPKSLSGFLKSNNALSINKDGFRHNALFVLFIPGFMAGYFTDSFLYSVLIGLPGVIDWGIIHTKIGLPKKQKRSKVFDSVLYSQCWEDPQIDREAFNIKEDDVVFSITSGGCNSLTFLIDNPESVIALDLNPHQNYLLELKIAAFRHLSYKNMLEFLGVRNSDMRIKYFEYIIESISPEARDYWVKNIKLIEKGIIHCGRYESYMKLLRNFLNITIGQKNIKKIYYADDIAERKILYEKKWENFRWKLFTKVLLSRNTMSLLFDKGFFKYLREDFSFGDHFAEKVKNAFISLPVTDSCFLHYILFGNYNEDNLPMYLRKENYEIIRCGLSKIKIVSESCESFFSRLPDNSISKFNFTNIFEWISEDDFERLIKETIRVAKDNAVITYRNLLVPREHPEALSQNFISDKQLAYELHQKDLSFIYNNYVVEKIIKGKEKWNIQLAEYQPEKG